MRKLAVAGALLLAACVPQRPADTATEAYLRDHPAPQYRALKPYYVHQLTEADCSAASTAMLINALLRVSGRGGAPVSEAALLDAVGNGDWTRAVADNGDGVSFAAYLHDLRRSLDVFGFPSARMEVFRPTDASPATRRALHAMLAASARDSHAFLLAVFDQGTLTGGEHIGHVSPIAAYDPDHRRALILDVDRGIEPYWAGEDSLLAALLFPDPTDPSGNGLVRVSLPVGMAGTR